MNAEEILSTKLQDLAEKKQKAEVHVKSFLECFGLDVDTDPHLVKTPERVVRTWYNELLSGYFQNPKDVLRTSFPSEDYDQMIIVKDIRFTSLCAHHLIPFSGTAKVGYIPDKKITGLSKIARLVDMFARRLQIQERLTQQIAYTLQDVLECTGVGVIMVADHQCMSCRGVNKAGAVTTTSCLLGTIREEPECRAEFMSL